MATYIECTHTVADDPEVQLRYRLWNPDARGCPVVMINVRRRPHGCNLKWLWLEAGVHPPPTPTTTPPPTPLGKVNNTAGTFGATPHPQ